MICSVGDCGKPGLARGYCSAHYNAWYKYGDPTIRMISGRGESLAWLAAHCADKSDDCLWWPFKSKSNKGYGQVWYQGKLNSAHRLMCIFAHGDPPPGAQAAHSCGQGKQGCVNPRHIRWATAKENAADKNAHGTTNRGPDNPRSKLSHMDALEIINLLSFGATHQSIANKFGVCRETISLISQGKTWKYLERNAT